MAEDDKRKQRVLRLIQLARRARERRISYGRQNRKQKRMRHHSVWGREFVTAVCCAPRPSVGERYDWASIREEKNTKWFNRGKHNSQWFLKC